MSVPAETWQLPEISPRAFQHPADRAATAALQQVPYLDQVVKRLIQLGYERALRQANLGASVRPGRLPLLAGLPLMAIRTALLEWFRAAELSCDRAAALVTRDPLAVCRSLMTIAGGESAQDLNLDAFIAQATDYSEKGRGMDRLS